MGIKQFIFILLIAFFHQTFLSSATVQNDKNPARLNKIKKVQQEVSALREIVKKIQENVELLQADKRKQEGAKFKLDFENLKMKMEDSEGRSLEWMRQMEIRVSNLEETINHEEKRKPASFRTIISGSLPSSDDKNSGRQNDGAHKKMEAIEKSIKNNSDRIKSIETELTRQKNSTVVIFTDYCTRTLIEKGGISDALTFTKAFAFCQQNANFTISSIPTRRLLGNVVLKPKARLYNGANLTGEFEDFNFEEKINPKCLDLGKTFENVGSLDTFGTCIRLFDVTNCWGQSMAFYPQTGSVDDTVELHHKKLLRRAKSIGSCFENELDESHIEVHQDGTKGYQKMKGKDDVHLVPDFVVNGHESKYNKTGNTPIIWYRTGHNGRVEYIRADLLPVDIERGRNEKQSNLTETEQEFYDQLEQDRGDQVGHFIGRTLGPQGGLPFFNIFPQSRRNKKLMSKLEKEIVERMSKNKNTKHLVGGVYINVHYKNDKSTRPTGMIYWITLLNQFRYLTNQRTS